MGLIKTNLEFIDFAKLYEEQKANSTFKGKSGEDWSKRAKNFNENVQTSSYPKEFVSKINFEGAKSLLDVGCGPGTIALEAAPHLEAVYGLDYSFGMLEFLKSNCEERGIKNITPVHKSWEDDWSDIPECDIIVASRSMEVKDIKKALLKLNEKANKRIYISFKAGGSFVENDILAQLKREIIPRPDYIYLVNILHSMGIYATVDFLLAENKKFLSKDDDEFVEKVEWSLGTLNDEEKIILKEYYNKVYKFKKEPSYIRWSLVSWEVNK